MEAKGRKMLAIGVIIGLCAVAMIGAAYAAVFGGTAKTYNEDNSVIAGSIVLTPDGATDVAKWQAITYGAGTQAFNTYTYAVIEVNDNDTPEDETDDFEEVTGTATAYYFTEDQAKKQISTKYYVFAEIGSRDIILQNDTGSAITSFTFTATQAGTAISDANFVYAISVEDEFALLGNGVSVSKTITDGVAVDGSAEITVTLYIGFEIEVYIPVSEIGPAAAATATGDAPSASYQHAANVSASGPAGFSDVDFKFQVSSVVTAA